MHEVCHGGGEHMGARAVGRCPSVACMPDVEVFTTLNLMQYNGHVKIMSNSKIKATPHFHTQSCENIEITWVAGAQVS